MSLRRRMVLAVSFVTTAALGGGFSAVSYAFNRQQEEQLDDELRLIAQQEAREAPALGFSFTSRPGPAANDVGPLTKYGVIFGDGNQVLAATPPFDVAPLARASLPGRHGVCFDFAWRGLHLRAVVVPIPGFSGRELLLATPRDDLDGDERFLDRAMLSAFLVALVWVVAVTHWGVGRLTQDHARIADVARKVAGGDLSARVASASSDAETRQLSQDIDDMIGTIAELLAARDRLVAHAAHELRAPLTNLYGELQQALRKERDAQGYRDAISRALPAARHLKLLIEDLLLLAKIRGEPVDFQPVSLTSCARQAIDSLGGEARERGVSMVLSAPATDVTLEGHERNLVRLVRNLLENAISHAPDGSIVEVRVRGGDPCSTIEVIDEGLGVSEEDRPHIFEPFYRSRSGPSNPDRGAGLGLGIARDIARSHGGDIALELSTSPRKTTFVVTLATTRTCQPVQFS